MTKNTNLFDFELTKNEIDILSKLDKNRTLFWGQIIVITQSY